MLAKKYRLPIQRVIQKNGKIIRVPYFLIKFFPNDLKFNRFGIIISKKVDSRSSARNKIKRIIFQAVEFFPKDQNINHKDFLIIVSSKAASLKKEELMQGIKEALNKI
ncbi:MAG: ribonuclease P protein component [bacterium]|nr:ribonuclease P protein component [bacterium]